MKRDQRLSTLRNNPNVGFLHYFHSQKDTHEYKNIDKSNPNIGYFKHAKPSLLTCLMTDSSISPSILFRTVFISDDDDEDDYEIVERVKQDRNKDQEDTSIVDKSSWEFLEANENKRKSHIEDSR